VAGNTSSFRVGPINIDKTPPVISIATPANGANYLLNQPVTAGFTCTDALSGVAPGGCAGSLNTTPQTALASGGAVPTGAVGKFNMQVNGIDNAGNSAGKNSGYIVSYAFTGFVSPLVAAGTYAGTASLGSALPLKWKLADYDGMVVSDLSSLVSLTSLFSSSPAEGACPVASSGPVSLIYSPGTGFTGNSNFRFTGGQFQFNWDTSTAAATGPGCYTLLMQLKDTTVKTFSIRLQ
jgi:hypothetical protein